MSGIVAIGLVCALVVFQGGYYAGAVCVIGVISAVAFIVLAALRKVKSTCPFATCFLLAIAMLYLISALVHGATLTMLQEAAAWFAVAGMSLWCSCGTLGDKRHTLDALGIAGVVFAVAGIAMFAGILPLEGSVNAGRLMFVFQYANSSGLFFAVMAVICLCSDDKRIRIASLLPIVALLLTQSVGAIVVFAVALVAIGIRTVRQQAMKPAILGAACAGVVIACIAAALLLPGRVMQASQTFIERIVQMSDALGLLGGNIALGIGPDQWQFTYPAIQTAQYKAADVHCSYLQMGLDAGIIAMLLIVAMLVIGAWRAEKRGDFASCVCVTMVAVHALFDFDLMFAAIVMLTALLLAEPSNVSSGEGKVEQIANAVPRGKAASALCWCTALCALAASCGGIYLDMSAGAVQNASARADAAETAALLDASPILQKDPIMQECLVSALYDSGDFKGAVKVIDQYDLPFATVDFQRVVALAQLGETADALTSMKDMLHARPYDIELYEATRQLVVEAGLGAAFADAFDAEAQRANELIGSGHAAWLANQKTVEFIGEGMTS